MPLLRFAVGVAAFAAVLAVPYLAQSYPQGAPSGFDGHVFENDEPRTCGVNGCHSSYDLNSGTGGVTIQAPASVMPGETVEVTVLLNNTTPLAEGAETRRQGFQASVRNHPQPLPGGEGDFVGTTLITDAVNTRRPFGDTSRYVTHSETGNQQTSWTFGWTAPDSATTATVYVAANAGNGGGLPDDDQNAAGDYIYTSTATIEVLPVAGEGRPEALALSLGAPHPNPSHGTAQARLTLAAPATVAARIVDGRGRTVRALPTQRLAAGAHALALPTAGLAPGTYFVVAEADGARQTQALVVAR